MGLASGVILTRAQALRPWSRKPRCDGPVLSSTPAGCPGGARGQHAGLSWGWVRAPAVRRQALGQKHLLGRSPLSLGRAWSAGGWAGGGAGARAQRLRPPGCSHHGPGLARRHSSGAVVRSSTHLSNTPVRVSQPGPCAGCTPNPGGTEGMEYDLIRPARECGQ